MGFFGSQKPPEPPVPIDEEIQRVKLEIQHLGLQIKQVNADMSTIRAQYSQHHVHGGGKLGGFVRSVQRSSKDGRLAKQQPEKDRLQKQKLALEQYLLRLKTAKAQGTTHVTH